MQKLREKALGSRRAMTARQRETESSAICARVIHSREFISAQLIACYLPTPDEVDTREIIDRSWRMNKRVFVPVVRDNAQMLFREILPDTSMRKNKFAIWEPESGNFVSPRALDIVITPTVAFDQHRNRIGMGGGYYDRCFAFLRHRKHWLKPKLFGIAYACQEIENISPNPWDIRLYRVISGSR
ncbi:MAG: 5-formyltetrahydrofolate cyclo-ligase [Gammaproteobacteria bacterium]|nr:5-formyltetrahydrofolate cyclo-ligase [Gammaproteobacteria bacterium]